MAKQEDIVEFMPKSVYYKVLTMGKGKAFTSRIKNATISYALYSDEGFVDCGTVKKVEPNKLTPAIGHSLVGMKKGEEREIYIHPNSIPGYFLIRSASQITAQVKLLDFEEGEMEVVLSKMDEMNEQEDFKTYLEEYKKFKGFSCFRSGYEFWERVKELKIDVDFEELSKSLRSGSFVKPFPTDKEQRKFLLDYYCYQFNSEYEKGIRPFFEF